MRFPPGGSPPTGAHQSRPSQLMAEVLSHLAHSSYRDTECFARSLLWSDVSWELLSVTSADSEFATDADSHLREPILSDTQIISIQDAVEHCARTLHHSLRELIGYKALQAAASNSSVDATTKDTIGRLVGGQIGKFAGGTSWVSTLSSNLDLPAPSLFGRDAVPGTGGFRNDPALGSLIDLALVDAFVAHPQAAGLFRQFPVTTVRLFRPLAFHFGDRVNFAGIHAAITVSTSSRDATTRWLSFDPSAGLNLMDGGSHSLFQQGHPGLPRAGLVQTRKDLLLRQRLSVLQKTNNPGYFFRSSAAHRGGHLSQGDGRASLSSAGRRELEASTAVAGTASDFSATDTDDFDLVLETEEEVIAHLQELEASSAATLSASDLAGLPDSASAVSLLQLIVSVDPAPPTSLPSPAVRQHPDNTARLKILRQRSSCRPSSEVTQFYSLPTFSESKLEVIIDLRARGSLPSPWQDQRFDFVPEVETIQTRFNLQAELYENPPLARHAWRLNRLKLEQSAFRSEAMANVRNDGSSFAVPQPAVSIAAARFCQIQAVHSDGPAAAFGNAAADGTGGADETTSELASDQPSPLASPLPSGVSRSNDPSATCESTGTTPPSHVDFNLCSKPGLPTEPVLSETSPPHVSAPSPVPSGSPAGQEPFSPVQPSSPSALTEPLISCDWGCIPASGPTLPNSESGTTQNFSASNAVPPALPGTPACPSQVIPAPVPDPDLDDDWLLIEDPALVADPLSYADDSLHLCPASQLVSLSDALSAPPGSLPHPDWIQIDPAPGTTSSLVSGPPSSITDSASSRPAGEGAPTAPLPAILEDGQRIAGTVRAILSSSSTANETDPSDQAQVAAPGNTVDPGETSEPYLDAAFMNLFRRIAFMGSSSRPISLGDWSVSTQESQSEDTNLRAANVFGLSYAFGSLRDSSTEDGPSTWEGADIRSLDIPGLVIDSHVPSAVSEQSLSDFSRWTPQLLVEFFDKSLRGVDWIPLSLEEHSWDRSFGYAHYDALGDVAATELRHSMMDSNDPSVLRPSVSSLSASSATSYIYLSLARAVGLHFHQSLLGIFGTNTFSAPHRAPVQIFRPGYRSGIDGYDISAYLLRDAPSSPTGNEMLLPVLRRAFVSAINDDTTLWWKLLENSHLLVSAAHAAAIHFGDVAFDALGEAVLPTTLDESRSKAALRVRVLIQSSLSAGASINDMESRMMDLDSLPDNCDARLSSPCIKDTVSGPSSPSGPRNWFCPSTNQWMRNLRVIATDDWIQRFTSYRTMLRDFGTDLGLSSGSRGLVCKTTTESAIWSLVGDLTSNSEHRRVTVLRRFETLDTAHSVRCLLAERAITVNRSLPPPTAAMLSWRQLVRRVRLQRLVVPALTAGLSHMSPEQLDLACLPPGDLIQASAIRWVSSHSHRDRFNEQAASAFDESFSSLDDSQSSALDASMTEDPSRVLSSISADAADNLLQELSALGVHPEDGAAGPTSIPIPLDLDAASFSSLQRSAIAKATVDAATLLSTVPATTSPDVGIGKRLRTGELPRARHPPAFYWQEHSDWESLVVGTLSPKQLDQVMTSNLTDDSLAFDEEDSGALFKERCSSRHHEWPRPRSLPVWQSDPLRCR